MRKKHDEGALVYRQRGLDLRIAMKIETKKGEQK
jgi:hypothetical protein